MAKETRSLWEIYDSETAPWRRGRTMLVCIGLFMGLLQCLVVIAQVIFGNIEAFLVFAILIILFWLQFYFVWIGVHWLRWLWGGGNLFTGFCLLSGPGGT